MSGGIVIFDHAGLLLRRLFAHGYEIEAAGVRATIGVEDAQKLKRICDAMLAAFRRKGDPKQGAWFSAPAIEFGVVGAGIYLDLAGHRLQALDRDAPLLDLLDRLGADLRDLAPRPPPQRLSHRPSSVFGDLHDPWRDFWRD
jgi:hypothetical protein